MESDCKERKNVSTLEKVQSIEEERMENSMSIRDKNKGKEILSPKSSPYPPIKKRYLKQGQFDMVQS